jgi:multiple sugar transport system substrate-binding protein
MRPPRTLSRRSLLAAGAGTALGGAALTGCGAGGGGPDLAAAAGVPREPATIRWWSFEMATHDGGDLRTALVDAFTARWPHLSVEIVDAPAVTDVSRTVLSTALAGGAEVPDVYMGDIVWPAQFGHHALALPLGEVVDDGFWRAYPEQVGHAVSYRDERYAFPFYGDQAYLYYRADLLERHGLDVPRTWEEVAEAALRITRAGDAAYGLLFQGAVYEGLTANVAEFLADAGGGILDGDGTRVTFGGRPAERALGFLREAVDTGVAPSAVSTFREQDTSDAFAAGQAVFLRSWAYVWGIVDAPGSAVAGRVGVTTRPGFDGLPAGGHGCLGGWCNFVNPHSRRLAAAVAFARFCAEEEAQMITMRDTAYLPSLTALRTGAAARRSPTPPLALAGDVTLVPRPTQSPWYPQVSKAVYTHVNTVLNGRATPAEAIDRVREDAAAALDGRSL